MSKLHNEMWSLTVKWLLSASPASPLTTLPVLDPVPRMNFYFLILFCPCSILGLCTCVLFLHCSPNSPSIFLKCQLHCHSLGASLSVPLSVSVCCFSHWGRLADYSTAQWHSLSSLHTLLLVSFSYWAFLNQPTAHGACFLPAATIAYINL